MVYISSGSFNRCIGNVFVGDPNSDSYENWPTSTQSVRIAAYDLNLTDEASYLGRFAPGKAWVSSSNKALMDKYPELNEFLTRDGCAKPANNIRVTLNGSPVSLSAPILNSNGSTLLPVRAIAELLGISVNYDSNYKVAIASDEDTTLEIPIGYSFGVNNGVKAPITGARSTLYNASTYLPVRYVSEQLGIKIDYNSKTKTVEIATNATTAPTPTVTPTPQVQIPTSEPTLETPNEKGNDPNTIIRTGQNTHQVDPSYVQSFKSKAFQMS